MSDGGPNAGDGDFDPRDSATDRDTKYRFVPVARRGYPPDAYYGGEDDKGASELATKGTLQVDFTTTGSDGNDSNDRSSSVPVHLYGPGDVTGIDGRQVARTEPEPGTTNFPPNYFAVVEFDAADLPWLFSPVSDDTLDPGVQSPTGKGFPWCCLVVLEKTDETRVEPGGEKGLPRIDAPLKELPPIDEAWAWAHAQVVGSPQKKDEQDLATALSSTSNLTRSRLLSPRNLRNNTKYIAAVVPTFEAGRKAGLGEAVDADDGGNGNGNADGGGNGNGSGNGNGDDTTQTMALAWDPEQTNAGTHTSDDRKTLPIYHHWEFSTGKKGDFEYLARRLEPRDLNAPEYDIGFQTVDVSDPGPSALEVWGDDPTTEPNERTVRTGGALRKANADALGAADYAKADELRSLLNEPAAIDEWADEDYEAVGPPIYGGRHAQVDRLPASVDQDHYWLRDLNLHPGNRLAAAVGAGIVRDEQEQLMAQAWEQVGQVREANRTLAAAQLSRAAMETALPDLDAAPNGWLAGFTAPMHDRSLVGEGQTAGAHLDDSSFPRGLTTAPFRRLTSGTGRLAGRLDGTLDAAGLVADVANGDRSVVEQERGVAGMGTARDEVNLEKLCARLPESERRDGDDGTEDETEERERPSSVETLLVHLGGVEDQGDLTLDLLDELAAALAARSDESVDVPSSIRGFDREVASLLGDEGPFLSAEDSLLADESGPDLPTESPGGDATDEPGTDGTRPDARVDEADDGHRDVRIIVAEIETEWLAIQPTIDLLRNAMIQVARAEEARDLPGVAAAFTERRARDLHADLDAVASRDLFDAGAAVETDDASLPTAADVPPARSTVLELLRAVADVERYLVAGGGSDPAYLHRLVCESVPDATESGSPDMDAVTALDPVGALVDRVENRLGGIDLGDRHTVDPLDRVMAYPEFPKPTYDDLKEVSEDYLLPGVSEVPKNTFGALETNPQFVESFLVGMNHEMASELLWRRYPTDSRGSYFRQFWDPSARVPKPDDPEDLKDVTELHTWDDKDDPDNPNANDRQGRSDLGSNVTTGAGGGGNDAAGTGATENSQVVVVIRGDLLDRYPSTPIYAAKAKRVDQDEGDGTARVPEWPTPAETEAELDSPFLRFPIFRGRLDPDVTFLGFDLTDDQAVGRTKGQSVWDAESSDGPRPEWVDADGNDDLGWFFVMEEPPGEVRFGLDVNQDDVGSRPNGIRTKSAGPKQTTTPADDPEHGWSGLSWGHLVDDASALDTKENVSVYRDRPWSEGWETRAGDTWADTSDPAVPDVRDPNLDPEDAATWGKNSAHMAYITWQRPVRIAIHADDLLPGSTTGGSDE